MLSARRAAPLLRSVMGKETMKHSISSCAALPATVAGAAVVAVTGASPAWAGCHLVDCVENVYVQPSEVAKKSCEDLWILRNSIFKDAGYCFKSERARAFFSNDGCKYGDEAAVPLNDYQRHNVDVLKAAEQRKGC
jgi:hypothetical protein